MTCTSDALSEQAGNLRQPAARLGFLKSDRCCCLQIDMPPQNMLYYVPAQRAWVKSEVEELIEVSLYCLSVFCSQLVQMHNCWDPETLGLTFYKLACLDSHYASHAAAVCSCLTCLTLLL